MHIVRFMHGFANQLFQLCLYKKLTEMYGDEAVFADRSFCDGYPIHGGFKLEPLYPLRYIGALPDDRIVIDEESFFTLAHDDNDHNYYYSGYWQDDDRFFPEDMGFISDLFHEDSLSPENRKILSQMESVDSVSVHVRRGDYVDYYLQGNIATPAFYANAVNAVRERVDDPSFFVFSNDLGWCRENLDFGDSPVCFVTGNEDRVELDILMMSRCRHNIISNSSFSWWAQYMNRNPDKIVVAPEYWYTPGIDISPSVDKLNKGSFLHVSNYRTVTEANEEPFFSVLIPVRDQKNGLIRCLSTLLNQPFGNIEIILVDDASSDGCRALEEEYAGADARITLMRNEKRESALAALLTAMDRAKGEYVLFADADDYLSEDACGILRAELTKERADILSFAWVTEPDREIGQDPPEDPFESLRAAVSGAAGNTLWNRCFSRQLVRKVKGSIEPFYCDEGADAVLSALFLYYAKDRAYTDAVLYHRSRENAGPASETAGGTDYLRRKIVSVKNGRDFLTEFFSGRIPDLLPVIRECRTRDADRLVAEYREMSRHLSVFQKTALIKAFDDSFDTRLVSAAVKRRLPRLRKLFGRE